MQPDRIVLQPRDTAFLVDLFECRVMTLRHAAALHFDDKSESAKKRLQKLKQAGFIRERPRRVSEPSILSLTIDGWRYLHGQGLLAKYPPLAERQFEKRAHVSALTLAHELAVLDIKAAFTRSFRKLATYRLTECCTWPRLLEFTVPARSEAAFAAAHVTIKPDGFLRILETADDGSYERAFYVEVDRSTEAQDILVRRATAYLDYYQSGGFALRQGGRTEEFRMHPFRVLVICRSPERQANLLEKLLSNNPPILTHTWVSTASEVMNDPLGAIWLRPIDVRDAPSYRALGKADRGAWPKKHRILD